MRIRTHNGISYEDTGTKPYNYRLIHSYVYRDTGIHGRVGGNPFVRVSSEGVLSLAAEYAWDGPSGPSFDTDNFMRGSLVHDALYQLMREAVLDHQRDRKQADQVLRRLCREDGMSWFRAWYVYRSVRLFGAKSARP